jgi:hypothetical protein
VLQESPDIEYIFDWKVSDEFDAEIIRDRGRSATIMLNDAGLQPIIVNVSDNRGNSAEVMKMVDVKEPQPASLILEERHSKDILSAPLSTRMAVGINFDHPRDYPIEIKWYLDGVELNNKLSGRHTYNFDEPGSYNIKVEVTSLYGQKGVKEKVINVLPNIPPICEPYFTDKKSYMMVYSNCEDEDGKIVSIYYDWGDGEQRKSSRVRFDKEDFPLLNLSIRAVDDGGEETITVINY